MNKKIIKLIPIFVLGIITVFSLSACSQKAKKQSTQDILMSKTWDEADSKGKINCQIEFNNKQLKSTQNNESSSENYSIRKENGKEILSPESEESFYITRYKNGFKLTPITNHNNKNIIILEPHQ